MDANSIMTSNFKSVIIYVDDIDILMETSVWLQREAKLTKDALAACQNPIHRKALLNQLKEIKGRLHSFLKDLDKFIAK